jgi:hypothetical protein
MALHVVLDARPEDLGVEPALEHRDHPGALAVGDGIEGIQDVMAALDGLPDLTGRREAVGVHRPEGGLQQHDVEVVLGMRLRDDAVGHPCGECLVEPQVVPPGLGHGVAEPVVGELVGHHAGEVAQLPLRRRLRIDQQQGIAEGDGSYVLHGAG